MLVMMLVMMLTILLIIASIITKIRWHRISDDLRFRTWIDHEESIGEWGRYESVSINGNVSGGGIAII